MKKGKFIRVFVTLMMLFQTFLPLGELRVSAATEVSPKVKIDQLSITKTDGNTQIGDANRPIGWWDSFLLHMSWDATDAQNTLQEGDYFEVELPAEFKFPQTGPATQFQVLNDKGQVAGSGQIMAGADGGGRIRVTFNNTVEGLYNVKGKLHLSATLNHKLVQANSENSITLSIKGKVIPKFNFHIGPGPGKIGDEQITKWGSLVPQSNNEMYWWIRLNYKKTKFVTAILGDELKDVEGKNPSLQYIEGSFFMYEQVYDEYGVGTKVGSEVNISRYVEFGPDKKTFKLDLMKTPLAEKLRQGKSFELRYKTTYVPGTKVANSIDFQTDKGNFREQQ